MLTPFKTVALTPSQTLLPIVTGFETPERGSSGCQSESVISVLAPQISRSPRTISLKAAITVPLKPQLFPIRTSAPGAMVDTRHGRLMPIRLAFGDERNVQF